MKPVMRSLEKIHQAGMEITAISVRIILCFRMDDETD